MMSSLPASLVQLVDKAECIQVSLGHYMLCNVPCCVHCDTRFVEDKSLSSWETRHVTCLRPLERKGIENVIHVPFSYIKKRYDFIRTLSHIFLLFNFGVFYKGQ